MNAGSYQYALPSYSLDGLTILDVGCGDGSAFVHPMFAKAESLHGVDIDYKAIMSGQKLYPHLNLIIGGAEWIDAHTESFDVTISRVSLPYTNIPVALQEIGRVTKTGGRLYLSLHDLRLQMEWLRDAIKRRAWRRIFDHGYIFAASAWFHLTGSCVSRPGFKGYETFQTEGRMRKELKRVGFVDITSRPVGHHWIIEAVKDPLAVSSVALPVSDPRNLRPAPSPRPAARPVQA